jgi:hypothetical protein
MERILSQWLVAWQHGAYITLPEEKVTIALSNKFDRRTYKVKNFGFVLDDYPIR